MVHCHNLLRGQVPPAQGPVPQPNLPRSGPTFGVLAVMAALACSGEPYDGPLPPWTGTLDTSEVTISFRRAGGPALIEVTGWANQEALARFEEAGLRPLPGYTRVEQLDSIQINIVGGTIPPGGLDRIARLPFVVQITPHGGG